MNIAERKQELQKQIREIDANYNKQHEIDFWLLWILAISMVVGLISGSGIAWTVFVIAAVFGLNGEDHILNQENSTDIRIRLDELLKLE